MKRKTPGCCLDSTAISHWQLFAICLVSSSATAPFLASLLLTSLVSFASLDVTQWLLCGRALAAARRAETFFCHNFLRLSHRITILQVLCSLSHLLTGRLLARTCHLLRIQRGILPRSIRVSDPHDTEISAALTNAMLHAVLKSGGVTCRQMEHCNAKADVGLVISQ